MNPGTTRAAVVAVGCMPCLSSPTVKKSPNSISNRPGLTNLRMVLGFRVYRIQGLGFRVLRASEREEHVSEKLAQVTLRDLNMPNPEPLTLNNPETEAQARKPEI